MFKRIKNNLVGYSCICNNVTYEELYNIARIQNCKSIEQLQLYIDCCNTCKLCTGDIKKIIDFLDKSI